MKNIIRIGSILLLFQSACATAEDPVHVPGGFERAYNPYVGENCKRFAAVKAVEEVGASEVPGGLPLPEGIDLVGTHYGDEGPTTHFALTGSYEEIESFLKTELSDSEWSDGGWSGGDDPLGGFVNVLIRKGRVRGSVTLVECQGEQALLVLLRDRS